MNSTEILKILPKSVPMGPTWRWSGGHVIVAGGFEDRATTFAQSLFRTGKRGAMTLVQYLPFNVNNDNNVMAIKKGCEMHGWGLFDCAFDREHPFEFGQKIRERIESIPAGERIYVDISAMSKMLLLYVLRAVWESGRTFSVIYAEALEYGPTEQEYISALAKGEFGQNLLMELLFSGVYEPVIPTEFSGRSAMGAPRALVAFLGYNKRQTIGAASAIPYQRLIPLLGSPEKSEWDWRAQAVVKINDEGLLNSGRRISEVPIIFPSEIERQGPNEEFCCRVPILDYAGVLAALLEIKRHYFYSHYLTVAPFGSKMQALATFLFTRICPEVQIVYASPRDYHPQYSRGLKGMREILFERPKSLEGRMLDAADPSRQLLNSLAAECEFER